MNCLLSNVLDGGREARRSAAGDTQRQRTTSFSHVQNRQNFRNVFEGDVCFRWFCLGMLCASDADVDTNLIGEDEEN